MRHFHKHARKPRAAFFPRCAWSATRVFLPIMKLMRPNVDPYLSRRPAREGAVTGMDEAVVAISQPGDPRIEGVEILLASPLAVCPPLPGPWPFLWVARDSYGSSPSNALAARKSAVSKPSVNQP
jgi:hypothetical protein